MGANIVCVTSAGGLPIFSKKIGNTEPLSFSTIGSLNGVHLFGKSKGILLESTGSDDAVVVWKEYDDSILLIGIALMNSKDAVEEALESIYNALVFYIGSAEIKNFKNVERFKRSVRPVYPVIDCIMECLDFGDQNIYCDLFNVVETMLSKHYKTLRAALDSFVDIVGSEFGCLTIDNNIVAATDGWWSLDHTERKILSYILRAKAHSTCFDMPIYLPYKSPTVPLRLVSVCLVFPFRVNVLCGSSPDVSSILRQSFQCWSPFCDTLKATAQILPRNVPENLQFNDSINSFLLVNVSSKKYLLCAALKSTKKESKSCAETLKTFYYQAAQVLTKNDSRHQAQETYWVAEYHKLHALRMGDDVICVLYHSSVPTPTMRFISRETLNIITSQTELGWNHATVT